jgi:hypothetical protein
MVSSTGRGRFSKAYLILVAHDSGTRGQGEDPYYCSEDGAGKIPPILSHVLKRFFTRLIQ